MSCTRLASACSLSVPPPQDWKMSGGLPACMLVVSLALNASFSRTVILMVTFGWAFMYSSAACFQTVFIGSVFWMCHQLIVTGLPDDDAPEDDLDELSSPPPHPAMSRAATSAQR